jgi:hypothetical protein
MHGNDAHPMRVMTRRAAGLLDEGWTADARHDVTALFSQLASEWHTRTSPERTAIVLDALDRGVAAIGHRPSGLVVEPGSGIGTYSAELATRWDVALAVELTIEMHRLAPAGPAHRVLADGSRLPLADGTADAVVLVNMFLFPEEVDRVLRADGLVVWVNSSGEHTPIHLPPDEVAAALPGDWDGAAARAGAGLWAVLRRSR